MLRIPAPCLAMAGLMTLLIQPGWAQTADNQTNALGMLPPGKPAGVEQARSISNRTLFIGASIVLVTLAFTLPASSTSSTATAASATNSP